MTRPQPPTGSVFRRKPVEGRGAPGADADEPQLKRSIGTFALTLFGVGATVGTGIFYILPDAVPEAGPAVVLSFLVAGLAAGLAAICYAEMAAAVPVSGSSYSYAYATLGEIVANGVGACLLLEYGVSASATAVGWAQYVNQLLNNVFDVQLPSYLTAGPWDETAPGWFNLPAVILVLLCCLLLIRGASESARTNTIMVIVKLSVLLLFAAIAFTAFNADRFADFAPFEMHGVTVAAATIFFTFIGLDAVSTAGDEVKDPQRAMPRAIVAALIVVVTIYLLTAVAALGAQRWQEFGSAEQKDAGLAKIVENVVGATWPGTLLSIGAVISIFSVTLVVIYGQTRILFAMARDGLLPKTFAKVSPRTMTPVNNTIVVAFIIGLLAAIVPLDKLIDLVSIGTLVAFIVVSLGVIILRQRMPNLHRPFKVPLYPITPIAAVLACLWILSGLHWFTFVWFAVWVSIALVFYLLWGRRHSRLNAMPPDAESSPSPSRGDS
ncbi:amino acid permease [Gordonia sinesedis]